MSPYRRRTATVLATAKSGVLQGIWAISAYRFSWPCARRIGTHNPLVAGSRPARPTSEMVVSCPYACDSPFIRLLWRGPTARQPRYAPAHGTCSAFRWCWTTTSRPPICRPPVHRWPSSASSRRMMRSRWRGCVKTDVQRRLMVPWRVGGRGCRVTTREPKARGGGGNGV